MHLDLHQSIALTRFAPPTFHIETEAPGPVAADLRFRHLSEQFADRREQSGIRGRIGARRAADRALVDVDQLIEMVQTRDPIVHPGNHARTEKMPRERALQNVGDKCRLA